MAQPFVFISYSRQDETEKEAILTHLKGLQQAGHITVWSDDDISAGAERMEDIAQATAKADIALLLVTANYLAWLQVQSGDEPLSPEELIQATCDRLFNPNLGLFDEAKLKPYFPEGEEPQACQPY